MSRMPLFLQVLSQGASHHSVAYLAQAATQRGGRFPRRRVLRGQGTMEVLIQPLLASVTLLGVVLVQASHVVKPRGNLGGGSARA